MNYQRIRKLIGSAMLGLCAMLSMVPQALAVDDAGSFYTEFTAANLSEGGSIILTSDITLTEAPPPVTGAIAIDGNGHRISGDGSFQLFVVDGGSLTIKNVTLTEGFGRNGGAIHLKSGSAIVEGAHFLSNMAEWGGAIATERDSDTLTVNNSRFSANAAENGGGAIFVDGGRVTIDASSFSDNAAAHRGGGLEALSGSVGISNSTFAENRAGDGGGIYISGADATLSHLTLVDNEAIGEGDGIYKGAGQLRLRNSIIASPGGTLDCVGGLNQSAGNLSHDGTCAERPSGDLKLGQLTDSPAHYPLLDGSPAVDAADSQFCPELDQIGTARPQNANCDIGAVESATAKPAEATPEPTVCTLANHILSANSNTSVGGCPAGTSHDIITLTEDIVLNEPLPQINSRLTIEGNGHRISGAGQFQIFVLSGGALTLKNLTLTDGYSESNGDAILVSGAAALEADGVAFRDNHSRHGGAIATLTSNLRLNIRNSLFDGNTAEVGGGAILLNGGALTIENSAFQGNIAENWGGAVEALNGRASISNSSFSRNEAGSSGGAILASGAETTMTHLTLIDNSTFWGEGGTIFRRGGVARLRNSIVAGGGDVPDCGGGLTESRGNFSQDGSCDDALGGNPRLGAFTGSPGYYPLLDGSPAVDAADATYCLETDQAGNQRPLGGGCDIGAIESATAMPAEPTPEPTECTLANHILSANTNTSVGGCPTGTSHDIITLSEDITLSAPLPPINGTITIEGNGHTISGDNRFRIFNVTGRKLTLNNLTLARAEAEGRGGAILVQNNAELVVNNSTFERNRIEYTERGDRLYGGYGGAIGTQGFNGRIEINSSEFDNNRAEISGGALNVTGGMVDIRGSAFTSNRGQGLGGAIEVSSGQVNIENSSFSRNQASHGGAIYISGGSATLTHLTLLGNSLTYSDGEGASIKHWGGQLQLRNSIVAGGGRAAHCHGNIDVSRGNFSRDGSCAAAEGGDPQLGEMTGEPGYFPPLENSPLVDAADPAFCLATDQTGVPRPQGGGCDIGAIEAGGAAPAASQSVAQEPEPADSACSVTTTHGLNFRDGPNGNRIGVVPAATTLTALSRTASWFNVEYRGALGWISADYVRAEGVCG